MWWKWYLAGIVTIPAIHYAAYIWRAVFWAWADTADTFKHAGLLPGRSRWNWLWIIPNLALRTFWQTLWHDLNGMRRSG